MFAHARGWHSEAETRLTAEQRAHLIRLERMRRRMVAIRTGRAPFPSRFGGEHEAKIAALREAGHLAPDQELFLRLCGPAEVDRQVTLLQHAGSYYGGIEVPSRQRIAREHEIQRFVAKTIRWSSANDTRRRSSRRPMRRCLTRTRRRRAPARRRVMRTRGSAQRSTRGGDPPEPPPEAPLHPLDREAA